MVNRQSFTGRAAAAGPFAFDKILVDGANEYSKALGDLINSSPRDDLPLICATMHVMADALAKDMPQPSYVDFLVEVLRRYSEPIVIKSRVPKKEGEA